MLEPYVPYPSALLRNLTKYEAIIGGVAAASFLLRDPNIKCDVLQIYVGSTHFRRFVNAITTSRRNSPGIAKIHVGEIPDDFTRERHIASVVTLHMHSSRSIIIYGSSVPTPLPIVGSSISTATMNYVTQHTFGCAYPRLTLTRRALLSNIRLNNCCDTDYLTTTTLMRAGFEFVVNPSGWPEFHNPRPHLHAPDTFLCLRAQYLCPNQGRYFGDKGSFVAFFDPLGSHIHNARTLKIPPFGAAVIWRLLTTYDCSARCEASDPILHEWLSTYPVLLLPNPLRSIQEARTKPIPSPALVTAPTRLTYRTRPRSTSL